MRTRSRVLLGALSLYVPGCLLAAAAPAATAAPAAQRLAAGVTYSATTFALPTGRRHGLPERMFTVSVTLSRHTTLTADAAHGLVGSQREPVLAIARRRHAVAAINGDFFSMSSLTAMPRDGLMRGGVTMKSARPGLQATLYVTTSGVAGIGDPGFSGTVVAGRSTHALQSVNDVGDATNHGRLTLITPDLAPTALHRRCTLVSVGAGTGTQRGHTVVRSLAGRVTQLGRPAAGTRELLGCDAAGQWLGAHLRPKQVVAVTTRYRVANLQTYIGGGRVLVRNGRPYNDRSGIDIPNWFRNPLTFACVSGAGRSVLLGVVDGRSRISAGMSYAELTTWLVQRGCTSAMVFDGGGSSTLVAALPGHPAAVQNSPSDWTGPRPVADALLVTVN